MKLRRSQVALGAGVVLIVAAIVVGQRLGYNPSMRPPHPLVGQPAPDFNLPIAAGPGAGDRVALSALRGEVVLLDFWASWCGPCRQSVPALNQIHTRYRDRIRLYGVNIEPHLPPPAIVDAHRQFGGHYASLVDAGDVAQIAYNVTNIPTLVLIDQAGVIRFASTGIPNVDRVSDEIEALIGSE